MNEIETTKLLKAQEQKKQASLNTHHTTSTHITHSKDQPLSSAHKGAVVTYCHSMVTTSRLLTGRLWTYLRNMFRHSRLGSIAFGIAVVYCAVHLFAAMRRRNIPKRITPPTDSDNTNNNTTTNTNNNTNINTNNANRNMYKSTTTNNTTTTRPKPTKQRGAEQYGGEEQGGGVWSSMTKLMSDAVSLK